MSQISGSHRVRDDLEQALEVGRKVTAKVQWIINPARNTRSRWIHCTPLLGINGLIAVWMVILVDDIEEEQKPQVLVPLKPPPSDEAGTKIAEVLPWESAAKQPGLSGAMGNGFRGDSVSGSGSSNASQAALSGDGNRSPSISTPPVPERNRLRKGRPSNVRDPSDPSKDAMTSAGILPFAHKNDTRYNVKVWSDAESQAPRQSMDSNISSKPPKAKFGQHPDMMGISNNPLSTIRPGPKINGRAYSFNSNSEHGISADEEERATGAAEDRPMSSTSQSSSSFAGPRRNSSLRSNGAQLGAPINFPGRADSQDGGEARRPARRTYKSLSPYGVLFQD